MKKTFRVCPQKSSIKLGLGLASISLLLNPISALAKEDKSIRCQPSSGKLIIRMSYGSEKEKWISDVTKAFNASNTKTTDGKSVICVEAYPKGSGDMVDEIFNNVQKGDAGVEMVSPASGMFLDLINNKYKASHSSDLLNAKGSLVKSSVVIAMWEPVAKSFNKALEQIGWRDILDRASKDPKFRYGQTNPIQSNSGLAALVAQFYTGATTSGKIRNLTQAHVQDANVRKFVNDVQKTVVQYGSSTGDYSNEMLQNGTTNLSAAVLYENLVIEANSKIQNDPIFKGLPKIVAIYPNEGTFITDHPFAMVSTISPEKRAAVEVYRAYLLSPASQLKALNYGFKPGVNEQVVPEKIKTAVWNAAHGVASFDSQPVILKSPQGDVIQSILDSWSFTLKKSADVVVVIDRSGSMGLNGGMVAAKIGANRVVDHLGANDTFKLIDFAGAPVTGFNHLTPKPVIMNEQGKQIVRQAINSLQPNGGTAMFDALKLAWDDLCQRESQETANNKRIHAIIVLTDGASNEGSISSSDMLISWIGFTKSASDLLSAASNRWLSSVKANPQVLNRANCKIPVFGISYGDEGTDYEKALKDISKSTGGTTNTGSDNSSVEKLFKDMAAFL